METTHLLQPLWDFLAHPFTPFIFITILVAIFAYGLINIRLGTQHIGIAFKKALALVSSSKNQTEFYAQFDKYSEELQKIDDVSDLWREYEETLIIPPAQGSPEDVVQPARRVIYLTARPHQYFSLDSVLGAKLNLSQVYAFSNYLIGTGLLFTFLGLAAAIAVAQQDLTTAAGNEGLEKLLSVASTKFLTSVVAILLSLVLSFKQRWWCNNLKKEIRAFCIALELRTEFLPAEKLLHMSLNVQQEQKLHIANLADNITLKFESILNQALPKSVSDAMAPLVDTLKQLAQRDHSNNEGALKSVLEEFLRQMHQHTGDGMNQLVGNIQTLASNLDQLVGKMESFGGNFGQEMNGATQRMAQTMERFVTDFSSVQQALMQFTEVLESLKLIAENIKHAGGQIQGAADGNKESAHDLSRTHGELAATVNGLSGNLEPLKDVVGQMAGALERLLSTSNHLNDAGLMIKGAANDFTLSSQKLDDVHIKIGDHMQGFKQVADSMQGNVQELMNASGLLAKAANPVEQLSRQMMEAVGSIQKSQDVITGAFSSMSSVSDSLKQVLAGVGTSWNSYQSRFEKVDKDLENAFTTLAKGTDDFQQKIKEFVTLFDSSFNTAIQDLSGAISELTEEREEQIQNLGKTATA